MAHPTPLSLEPLLHRRQEVLFPKRTPRVSTFSQRHDLVDTALLCMKLCPGVRAAECGYSGCPSLPEGHFASWLGLCPNNRKSGDKILGRATRRVTSRAASAFRMAASVLLRSQSYLGAQFRRLRMKLGAPKAITAMAHRLARLVHRLLKHGHAYVDRGTNYYEERYRAQQIRMLQKKATQLGITLQMPELS